MKSMIQNLHTHTTFCDGNHSAEQMVESAISKGLSSIGFSGHAPIPNETWCMTDVSAYCTEIKRLQTVYENQIEIFLGLENEFLYPYVDLSSFDYTISSVHCTEQENQLLWVDLDKDSVLANIERFYHGNMFAYIEEYYMNVIKASKQGDILGHMDLITKFNKENDMFDEYSKQYIELVEHTIKECVKQDIIFEINTGAISRGYLDRFYPHPQFIDFMKKEKANILISSDTHSKDTIDCFYAETVMQLKQAGFQNQMQLTKNGFVEIAL